ncbi:MAG: VIT domain-containing protein [Sandaracinaceae bacterium]
MTRTIWGIALAALALAAGCGPDAPLDRTLATIERVRGEATLDDEPLERIGRAVPGQTIAIEEGGLARLSLDSGARFLLDASARVAIVDEATVRLEGGRAYAEAGEGEELFLTAGERSLRVSDASVSAELGDALAVYVVRGEVSWRAGEARGIARAGERLTLAATEGSTEPVTLWRDWTGGLARPGPADARGPEGVGVLEARVPDEVGQARWPLVIRRLDVQVRIVGDLAVTEVEQVFFNPASEMVEGLYRIRVPEEAVLQRFAVDRNGHLVDGYVREKAQAQAAYEAQVYRGSQLDPALLEWVAPGRYRARIYPIRPGETRRIVVRYAEWLAPIEEGGPRLYRYPMGGGRDAPRVQELSIAIDVEEAGVERLAAGMGAAVEGGRVRLRRSDFAPRSDFWLELHWPEQGLRAWRAPHEPPPRAPDARTVVGEADERDYFYLPLRLPERLFADARAEGRRRDRRRRLGGHRSLASSSAAASSPRALTAHLGANDQVAIVTTSPSARRSRARPPSARRARSGSRRSSMASRVPAGGATDLGAAVAAAAELLDPDRPEAR